MEQLPINVCFEIDSLLTLYYFLLTLYVAIFNSLLTVPQPLWCKKKRTSGFALSVLLALQFYEYEISLLSNQ